MAKPLQLFIIRHGETEWSLSGQHTGRTDLPLIAEGEERARKLKTRLEGVEFSHVFTSPLLRARQTCGLAGLDSKAELEPDLMEWNYGIYEGVRSVDIRKDRPGWNVFKDGCPNGEMPQDVTERAGRLITRLCFLQGNIALFTHGQFGTSLGMTWLELPLTFGLHFPLSTASISILGTQPGHADVHAALLWNSTPDGLT